MTPFRSQQLTLVRLVIIDEYLNLLLIYRSSDLALLGRSDLQIWSMDVGRRKRYRLQKLCRLKSPHNW